MVDARGRRRHGPALSPTAPKPLGCEPVFFSTLVVALCVPGEIPESLARAKTRAGSPGVILNRYGLFPGYM